MRRLLALTGLLLAAGCTATSPGTPVAGDDPTTVTTEPTTTTTATTTTATTASRPRDIDIAGLQVCPLLGKLPLGDYGVDPARTVGGESSLFPGSQDCFANGPDTNLGLTLVAVVGQGAAEYLDGARAEVTETAAGGFPVYVLKTAEPSSCFGVVDVHEKQMVFVNYGVNVPGEQPVTPQRTLCDRVTQIASATITQLGS